MRPALCLLALAACVHPAASPLDRYVAASGGAAWDAIHVVRSTGTITLGGMSGTITTIEDADHGRTRTDVDLGTVQMSQGNDGKVDWERSPGGEVAILDDPQTKADEITQAWLDRHDFHGEALAPLGARDKTHGFHATPHGGTPIDLWFDDATGLLVRTVEPHGTDTITTTFSDYRAVGAVQMAFTVVEDSGDPRNLVTMTFTSIDTAPALAADAFDRPKTDDERLTFADGATSTDVHFDLVNNHIYVDAKVDGQPVRMLVDTGGLNMLTPEAAKRLGLTTAGKIGGGGAGSEKVDVGLAHGQSLELGAIHLADPVFYVIDVGALSDVEGEHFDGLVGYELFQRLAVRIDYPGRTLTLMRPAAFTPPTGAIAVPFELRDRTPVVDGAIDGIAARISIDTGARNSLTATAPFVKAHDLVAKYKPKFETVTGWGVGGEVRSSPVRFGEIDIGAAKVKDVAGDLFTGDKGAMADPDTSGNLGGGVLSRFVVTFDYGAHTMYLEPAASPPPRDVYDRAGLFVLGDGDALKIVAITPGGPAEKAKLAVGDHITAIDGAATNAVDARKVFTGAVGEKHTLAIAGKGSVTITLAELLP